MTSAELDNLVRIGKLKREPSSARELRGLRDSAQSRLADAGLSSLSFDSRLDLAYNAAHALALCALQRRNLAEYEGHLERDDRLLTELIAAATTLRAAIDALPPPEEPRR